MPSKEEMNVVIFESIYAGKRARNTIEKCKLHNLPGDIGGKLLYDIDFEWIISAWNAIMEVGGIPTEIYDMFHDGIDEYHLNKCHQAVYDYVMYKRKG